MNLQLQREKKRIARIGQASTEVEGSDHDFMSEIIKQMDFDMVHSKTVNSLHNAQERSFTGFNNTGQASLSTSNMSVQHKIKMQRPLKKFLPEKKHPLMEKCQRNLKYLKHNRSIPKQRAHVSFIPSSPKTQINKPPRKKEELGKFVEIQNISNQPFHAVNANNFSGISDTDKSSLDMDSDNYENFIRAQKQMPQSDETDSETLVRRKKLTIKKKSKVGSSSNSKQSTLQCYKNSASDMSDTDFYWKNQNCNSHSITVPRISKRKFDESDSDDSIGRDKFITSKTKSKTKPKKKLKKKKFPTSNLQCPEISLKRKLDASDISDNSTVNTGPNNSALLVTTKDKSEKRHKSKKLKNISKSELSSFNRRNPLQFQRKQDASNICDDSNTSIDADEMKFVEFSHSDASVLEHEIFNSDNEIDDIFSHINSDAEKIDLCSSFDLTNADTKKFITQHFSCSVRIARDPILDERAALIVTAGDTDPYNSDSSDSSLKLIEQSNIVYNLAVPRNDSEVVVLEKSSDSDDDDCQFLCEVLKPNCSATNDTLIKLNEKSCTHSTTRETLIPVSVHNAPNTSNINVCGKASSDRTSVDRESKFNIKISSIQSLRESDYSDPSVNISESNTNMISTTDIACDTKSQTFVSGESVPVKHTLSENFNCTEKDIKQNSSQVLIPNLDKLLNSIDFKLINQVSKQSPISDAAVINKAQQISADKKCTFLAEIPLAISTSHEQSTSMFMPNLENNSHSNHLNVASDPSLLKCVDIDKDDHFKLSNKPNSETVNKIDLKKILLLSNSKQITDPCIEEKLHDKQGYSIENFNEILPSVTIPEKPKIISLPVLSQADSFWQDLKDTVTLNNCLSNNQYSNSKIESKTGDCSTSLVIQDCPNINRVRYKSETIPIHVNDLSKSNAHSMINDRKVGLQVNISETDALTIPSVSNRPEIFSNETLKVCSINQEPYECPSEELDCIAAKSIRELCEQKRESISPLFNLYNKELKHYDEIVSTEMNVSAGLRMLEEKQAKKIKYLEIAIRKIVQHDPCFHKVKEEKCSLFSRMPHADYAKDIKVEVQKPVECFSSEVSHEESTILKEASQSEEHLKQSERCDNCGREAKFRCQSCRKAYFCSSQCGMDFWEKEHSVNCY